MAYSIDETQRNTKTSSLTVTGVAEPKQKQDNDVEAQYTGVFFMATSNELETFNNQESRLNEEVQRPERSAPTEVTTQQQASNLKCFVNSVALDKSLKQQIHRF
ncbi:hypothetical protein HELRODRAFT_172622 [Helobdella robusta]|uniref:Uncharacterized protein n=1 Tax=Helobdella robusta TaxID=6412 RepID=T1F5N3_HELRO|nr:hypothetical protein HELRODRAFT_172622 [Helobdella robusta]ESO04264.1 hypothetical protein HELRODRAFT_172622 [Helobdella robusta]